jgi:putative nucleotidyltransferase with HDIG domain
MDIHENTTHVPFEGVLSGYIPTDRDCFNYWDKFSVLKRIRKHSLLVTELATDITQKAQNLGWQVNIQAVRAAALLHDLAKTYTLQYGGDHCQLGAAWVMQLTSNTAIAQGIIHHLYWPGTLDLKSHYLPLILIYADKRVKHDQVVSVQERFEDLFERYGKSSSHRAIIERSLEQIENIEKLIQEQLG